MRVVYSDAVPLPAEVEAETGAERLELTELLGQADFVSIHPTSHRDAPPVRRRGVPGDEAHRGRRERLARPVIDGRRSPTPRVRRDLRPGWTSSNARPEVEPRL